MPLANRGVRKRRNQFNVSLGDESAGLLRAEAKRLRTDATTLARNLLEHALAERTGRSDGVAQALDQVREEVRALRRSHINATMKLLQRGGMSDEAVVKWAKAKMKMTSD
jgi:hypothetical protein